jgi:hypothetical protein
MVITTENLDLAVAATRDILYMSDCWYEHDGPDLSWASRGLKMNSETR